jgi:signal transduction histidine kinase
LELDYQPVSLDKCIGDVIFSFSNQFEDKGLFLHFKVDPLITGDIYSDEVRIKQIIYNLIGNAFKFTNTGGVSISVSKGKNQIIFTLKDSGIGLTPEQMNNLFTEYSQADQTIQTNYGGTGLGLCITQKLVTLLGGTIEVLSEYGKGSEFIFTIQENKFSIN